MTRSRLVPVLLSAVLLVGAANLGAYAATGAPLLLGKANTATKTTKLKTTGNKAALSLKSKATVAPLAVSNSTKVAKFNADLVDGLDGAALQNKSYVYNLTATGVTNNNAVFTLTGLPPGRYIASYSVIGDIAGAGTLFGCYLLTGSRCGSRRRRRCARRRQRRGPVPGVRSRIPRHHHDGVPLHMCAPGRHQHDHPRRRADPARVTLTRIDDVTKTDVVGANSPTFRGTAPRP